MTTTPLTPTTSVAPTTPPPTETVRPPGYPLVVATTAFGCMLASLGFALYGRYTGDAQGMDVGLAVASLAFVTSLVAAYVHQRRTR